MGECSHCRLRAQVQILFTISSSGRRSLLRVNVSVRRDIPGETRAIIEYLLASCESGALGYSIMGKPISRFVFPPCGTRLKTS